MSSIGDNYTIHKVSLKRTRQACGPCRRKKARCPGEKPSCSLCHRLGQRCSYGPQPSREKNHSVSAPVQSHEPPHSTNEVLMLYTLAHWMWGEVSDYAKFIRSKGMSRPLGGSSALKRD
ncbi:hypothetical protein N7447_006144 [Penicillium robsamsonii]|uniref:uncharacterized protein n=1 Tax=Penicillium robsamsonii TaxID=1792511 RepID=UPI0025486E13|nr:uncharacterized protein N7447_006144 [Penicillium robsamsonii]KAJ5823804.1 hypothetical protein N7447_006144 [Penicillium robsamsonii]